jgi:hypothetical protein
VQDTFKTAAGGTDAGRKITWFGADGTIKMALSGHFITAKHSFMVSLLPRYMTTTTNSHVDS